MLHVLAFCLLLVMSANYVPVKRDLLHASFVNFFGCISFHFAKTVTGLHITCVCQTHSELCTCAVRIALTLVDYWLQWLQSDIISRSCYVYDFKNTAFAMKKGSFLHDVKMALRYVLLIIFTNRFILEISIVVQFCKSLPLDV